MAQKGDEEPDTLTRREREVAALVCHGFANKEIARRLGLAEGTVKTHLSKIFEKLGIQRRSQLIVDFSEHVASREADAQLG
jgi:DNA-binding NarL/FixJ family response regulator